jgi:hypothetical protein
LLWVSGCVIRTAKCKPNFINNLKEGNPFSTVVSNHFLEYVLVNFAIDINSRLRTDCSIKKRLNPIYIGFKHFASKSTFGPEQSFIIPSLLDNLFDDKVSIHLMRVTNVRKVLDKLDPDKIDLCAFWNLSAVDEDVVSETNVGLFGLDCEEMVRFPWVLLEISQSVDCDEVVFAEAEIWVKRDFLVNVNERMILQQAVIDTRSGWDWVADRWVGLIQWVGLIGWVQWVGRDYGLGL